MSSKIVALSALLAVARAGNLLSPAVTYAGSYGAAAVPAVSHVSYAAPVGSLLPQLSYAAAASPLAVQVHAPAIGSSHQSTLRSLDGNSAISHYSKSVDTAFSSVRKFDTRVTNDAKILTPALAYAAAAPIVKTAPILGYNAATPTQYGQYGHYAYAAEIPASHVISHTSFNGIGAAYAF